MISIGKNFKKGKYCIIEDDVYIGDSVTLKNKVNLRSGTVIGNNTVIGENCTTTGLCIIGNRVTVRLNSIIAKATIVEDDVFIAPGVMITHTKEIRNTDDDPEDWTCYIRAGAMIGMGAILISGNKIGFNSMIAPGSVVTKDVDERIVVGGIPARKLRDLRRDEYFYSPAHDIDFVYSFNKELASRRLPSLKINRYSNTKENNKIHLNIK